MAEAANASIRRPLSDVLDDPSARWSDIRDALKTQGRGSMLDITAGAGGKHVAATTNAGMLRALRDSISLKRASGEFSSGLREGSRMSPSASLISRPIWAESEGDGHDDAKRQIDDIHGEDQWEEGDAKKQEEKKEEELWGREVAPDKPVTLEEDNTSSISNRLEGLRAKDSRQMSAPQESRLAEMSSAKGASFRGSLRNVLEGKEAEMGDLDSASLDSSDRGSLAEATPCRPPSRQSQRNLPDRCLMRSFSSARGRLSFRGSLRNVLEEAEAEAEAEAEDCEDNHPKDGRAHRATFRRARMESAHTAGSNSGLSQGLALRESINILDFGFDPYTPMGESARSLVPSSDMNDSMSHLVDEDGFLSWGDNDSSPSCLIGYRPASKRMHLKRSDLADSQGLMGRGAQGDSLSSIDATAVGDKEDGKDPDELSDKKAKDAADEVYESWCIEDYEDPDGDADVNRNLSGNILLQQMRRFSSGITLRRGQSVAGVAAKTVGTDDVKRALLMSRELEEKEEGAGGGGGPRLGSSALRSFFCGKRGSDSSSGSDRSGGDCNARDSRPAIRISCEDGVNVEDLRREYSGAGNDGRQGSGGIMGGRLKMGFL